MTCNYYDMALIQSYIFTMHMSQKLLYHLQFSFTIMISAKIWLKNNHMQCCTHKLKKNARIVIIIIIIKLDGNIL